MANSKVTIGDIAISNNSPITLIAGPCQLESKDHAFNIAGTLKEITDNLGIGFIYKTSFDKANRTSSSSPRGVGLEASLSVFSDLKSDLGIKILTDIHDPYQAGELKEVCDVLQIPAFLCRQTDLLHAAANTGLVVNIKKGQFLAPWDIGNAVKKVEEAGNSNILLTERGASFGYNCLVSDMRSLPIMAETTGCPVVFDATHSVQQPGGKGTSSGGQREFVPVLARAAVAVGVAAVFLETHENPDNAPSDGPNMVNISDMPNLLEQLVSIDNLIKKI